MTGDVAIRMERRVVTENLRSLVVKREVGWGPFFLLGFAQILGEESYGGREEEEEEPEWMTFAPTSQMEFIELKGFDDDEDRHKHDAEAGEKDEDG